MSKKFFLLFILIPFLNQSQIASILEEWKNDKALKNSSIGFCVMNAANYEVVSEYNSHQFLIPASTLKIVTTSAAIGILGANYRYETKIYYTGNLNKVSGVLDGDLIVTGSGDPTLQSGNFSKDNESVTDKWAKILKEKGLKEIKGSIIGDATCFSRDIPNTWVWEDINNYYGAAPCGLSYMDNKFKVIYTSGESGSEASLGGISPSYKTVNLKVISHVIAKGTGDEAYAYGDPFSFTKEIRGTIPPNKTNYEVELVLPDPALLCAENLHTSLTQMGIKCSADAPRSLYRKNEASVSKQLLYTHYSPTLDKIIFYTNLTSNNHYCETLLLTIGKGDKNSGLNSVNNYWFKRGLDSTEIYMEDASGLSRINTITSHYETSLLCKIYRDSISYRFFDPSLPRAGRQVSMSSIGKGTEIENNLRAKTGYIRRARAYCGYVKTKSGKDLAFSLFFNNYNCSAREAKIKMEKFMIALADL